MSDANTEEKASQQQNENSFVQHMRMVRTNHPDCIPVYFVKHKEAPDSLKGPTTPLVLFAKHLKIQQAMYNLYKQIDTQKLFFFCLGTKQKNKVKYVRINPGPTIEELFNKYGRNYHLMLIYGNDQIGMAGLLKVQKILIIILIVIGSIYAITYGYSYLYSAQHSIDL